jgi:chromosome segregation ATPase
MKPAKWIIAVAAACLTVGLMGKAAFGQSAQTDTGPSPEVQAALDTFRGLETQYNALHSENGALVATVRRLHEQLQAMETGSASDWVRARREQARTVYYEQIKRLQLEMRETLKRLASLPRGSTEAASLQARVKEIDNQITAYARAMGVIQKEQERLRLLASRWSALSAQEKQVLDRINGLVATANSGIEAMNAAFQARNNAGALSAINRATAARRQAISEAPRLLEIQRQLIALLESEIAARGSAPALPELPPAGDDGAGASVPPAPREPEPEEVNVALQAVAEYGKVLELRDEIEAQRREEERLRKEIQQALKEDLVDAVKEYREEVRKTYGEEIAPRQRRLTEIEEELRTLNPDSEKAKSLRNEAERERIRMEQAVGSLQNQKRVLDRTVKELETGREPIRHLEAAEKQVMAEINAARSALLEARKAFEDSYHAAVAAKEAGDRAAWNKLVEQAIKHYSTVVYWTERYKVKQAELVTIRVTQKAVLDLKRASD